MYSYIQNRLIQIEIQKLGIRSKDLGTRSIFKESDPLDGNLIQFWRNEIQNIRIEIQNVLAEIQNLEIRSTKLEMRSVWEKWDSKNPESDPKIRNQIQWYLIIQGWNPITQSLLITGTRSNGLDLIILLRLPIKTLIDYMTLQILLPFLF